jgi:hypothetical protein
VKLKFIVKTIYQCVVPDKIRDKIYEYRHKKTFQGSAQYWETRYREGGNSGAGSYTFFAEFKSEILNQFVLKYSVQNVMEFGCGDGNQLMLAKYPHYTGFDVSNTAITKCKEAFKNDTSKEFYSMGAYKGEKAELVISLDVLYHLIEDDVFEKYMKTLFNASKRYVIIYSSDMEGQIDEHVKHREFTKWIKKNLMDIGDGVWILKEHIPNRYPYTGDSLKGSFSEFFIYEKK